jgi:SAM-dependent methyltransferase
LDPHDPRALNRAFYDTFAAEFSRSRESLNPGIPRALAQIDRSAVLDVGCGDGRLRRALPPACRYLGLDFSARLIGRGAAPGTAFALADLAAPLPVRTAAWPAVACFAALHHLTDRPALLAELARVVAPGGRLALSVWQFSHDARMRRKIVQDLGGGDYLLHWKTGGRGLRFVHEVTKAELRALAEGAGLAVLDLYRSDGRSGDLGLYAILGAAAG